MKFKNIYATSLWYEIISDDYDNIYNYHINCDNIRIIMQSADTYNKRK